MPCCAWGLPPPPPPPLCALLFAMAAQLKSARLRWRGVVVVSATVLAKHNVARTFKTWRVLAELVVWTVEGNSISACLVSRCLLAFFTCNALFAVTLFM